MEILNYSNFIKESVEQIKPPDLKIYGKGVLKTFLKCLTALGYKENSVHTEDVPTEFLLIFKFPNIDSTKISSIFSRFKSLKELDLDYSKPNMSLYFGIKCTREFEYGYYYDKLIPIGRFKLNKSIYNYLKLSELKSLGSFRKLISNLSLDDILLMCKIKSDVIKYSPGYFEKKMSPVINDKIITFGYFGLGKWNNGIIDEEDYDKIKNNFKIFLKKLKWVGKITVNVKAEKFWVYFNIKIGNDLKPNIKSNIDN